MKKLVLMIIAVLTVTLSSCDTIQGYVIDVVFVDDFETQILCKNGTKLDTLIPLDDDPLLIGRIEDSSGTNFTGSSCEELNKNQTVYVTFRERETFEVTVYDRFLNTQFTFECIEGLHLQEILQFNFDDYYWFNFNGWLEHDFLEATCDNLNGATEVDLEYTQAERYIEIIDNEGKVVSKYEFIGTTTLKDIWSNQSFPGELFYDEGMTIPVNYNSQINTSIRLYAADTSPKFVVIRDFDGNDILIDEVRYGEDVNEAFPQFNNKLHYQPGHDTDIATGAITEDTTLYFEHTYTVDNNHIGLLLASYNDEFEQVIMQTFIDNTQRLNIDLTAYVTTSVPGTMITHDAQQMIDDNIGLLVVVVDNNKMVENILAIAGDIEVIFVCAQHMEDENAFLNKGSMFTIDAHPKMDIEALKDIIIRDYINGDIEEVTDNLQLDYVAISGKSFNDVYGNNAFSMWQSMAFEEVETFPETIFVEEQLGQVSGVIFTEALVEYYENNGTGNVDVFITTTPEQTEEFINLLYDNSKDYVVYGLVDDDSDLTDLYSKGLDYAIKIDYEEISEIVFQAVRNVQTHNDIERYTPYDKMLGLILQYNIWNQD